VARLFRQEPERGQRGVTLIEVLVGFVIFTGSLVAVLDYVGNQVFAQRQSEQQYRRLQVLQQWRLRERTAAGRSLPPPDQRVVVLPGQVEAVEVLEQRRQRRMLLRRVFTVRDAAGSRSWTLLELQ
jgi:type II secretory pathway pseudopilin PulG